MRLLYQTRHGPEVGNCYETCVAILLGCEIEDVPDRARFPDDVDPTGRKWERALHAWFAERGVSELLIDAATLFEEGDICDGTLFIGIGWAPGDRRGKHATICRITRTVDDDGDAEMSFEHVHDPHEGWNGLEELLDVALLLRRGP